MRRLFLYASSGEAVEQLENEMQDSRKDQRVHTRNDTDLGHAEERSDTKQSAARPGRAPQDHRGVLPMPTRRHVTQMEKRELREAKRTSDEKNKSKSIMEK